MDAYYQGVYRDAAGEEAIVIHNDGNELRTTIRGVEFMGNSLDLLEPIHGWDQVRNLGFTVLPQSNYSELRDCEFYYEMPVPVVVPDDEITGTLKIQVILMPVDDPFDYPRLFLTLRVLDTDYALDQLDEWFEDGMLRLQAKLPEKMYIKCCSNCMYSDYSPVGHGFYGSMMCFRGNKVRYTTAQTKSEYMKIPLTAWVQETYLCPEFERRVPGIGYRG